MLLVGDQRLLGLVELLARLVELLGDEAVGLHGLAALDQDVVVDEDLGDVVGQLRAQLEVAIADLDCEDAAVLADADAQATLDGAGDCLEALIGLQARGRRQHARIVEQLGIGLDHPLGQIEAEQDAMLRVVVLLVDPGVAGAELHDLDLITEDVGRLRVDDDGGAGLEDLRLACGANNLQRGHRDGDRDDHPQTLLDDGPVVTKVDLLVFVLRWLDGGGLRLHGASIRCFRPGPCSRTLAKVGTLGDLRGFGQPVWSGWRGRRPPPRQAHPWSCPGTMAS